MTSSKVKLIVVFLFCLYTSVSQISKPLKHQLNTGIFKPYPLPSTDKPCPDCFVTQICGNYKWTKWMDRDNTGGKGDYEMVELAIPLGGCQHPIWI